MADVALTNIRADILSAAAGARVKPLRGLALGDATFCWATRIAAYSVLFLLACIIVSLVAGAWPALKTYGYHFLTTQRWAPSARPEPILGGLGPIYGTLVSSLLAMVVAVPVGLGIAIFLTELCPPTMRRPSPYVTRIAACIANAGSNRAVQS